MKRIKNLFLILTLMVMSFGILTTTDVAEAGSVMYSDDTTGGPTFVRPFSSCTGSGPTSAYHAQPFWVDLAGTYDFDSVQGYDGYMFLYIDPFDPANPTVNCLIGNDDGTGGVGTSNFSYALAAGQTYYVVMAGFGGAEGSFTNTISGPGQPYLGMFTGVALSGYAVCSGDDLEININGGDLDIDVYESGAYVGTADALGQWYILGPGAFNDVTLVELGGDNESLNLGSFNCPSYGVPNLGLVQINGWQATHAYDSPGGEQLPFALPADADGNGFDTYVVTDVELYNGEYWLGLFIGGPDWAYVPYSAVQPLSEIAGID